VRTDSLPAGQPDIYRATRASIGDAFAAPVRFPTASTNSGYETKVSITADGGYLVVGSSQTGGAGGVDVWEATNPGSGFGGLSRTHVMMLDDSGNQQDPTISSDGLALYEAPDSTGTQQIMVATRQDRTHNFGAPQQIAELVDSDGYGTADPAISVDQRIILMSSARTGTAGQGDLWYATRASVNDPFGTPINVPGVGLNTASNEGDAHLSADGCRLYFASDRDTGMDWDLFVATAH
jgi:Tol biopolymer transport system component